MKNTTKATKTTKTFFVILSVFLLLTAVSCDHDKPAPAPEPQPKQEQPAPSPAPEPQTLASFTFLDPGEIMVSDTSLCPLDGKITFPSELNGQAVTSIAVDCLNNLKGTVTCVEIPSCISTIPENAFEDATALVSVIFNTTDASAEIESMAFAGCTNLQMIVVKSTDVYVDSMCAIDAPTAKVYYGLLSCLVDDFPTGLI